MVDFYDRYIKMSQIIHILRRAIAQSAQNPHLGPIVENSIFDAPAGAENGPRHLTPFFCRRLDFVHLGGRYSRFLCLRMYGLPIRVQRT